MNIRQILDGLDPGELRRLTIAFNEGLPQHVEYSEGKFVGVHIHQTPNMLIRARAGLWSEGVLIRKGG